MTLARRQSLLERAAEVYGFADHVRLRDVPVDMVQDAGPILSLHAAGVLHSGDGRTSVSPPSLKDVAPADEDHRDWASAFDGGEPIEAKREDDARYRPDLSAIPAEFLADPDADPDDFVPPAIPAGIAQIDRGMLAENGLIVPGAPVGPLAEEFRLIKRQLLVTHARIAASDQPDKARTILVCSARPRDGKTFCAVNLALSMAAERDTEVLLVDADVAKPDVLRQLGLTSGPGLLDALADGTLDVEDMVIRTDVPNLSVLPAGARSASDTELLASARTRAVIARLLSANPRRLVVFDSPPALAASPAAVLAMLVGQVMLVVRADRTPEAEVAEAADLLDGCEHIQLVLNATSFVPGAHRFGSYYGTEDRA